MKKNIHNIAFLIHPTQYSDFDLIAIGDIALLKQIYNKDKEHYRLFKSSKFGGIPILLLDTCDTLRDAMSCIKEYKKQWIIIDK